MKANELRIGNYFQYSSGNVTTVYEILFDRREGHLINGQIPEGHFKPIEITANILENAGFKKGITEKHFANIHMLITQLEGVWLYMAGWNKIYLYYVHQLQNLHFSHTGKELEFKEPITLHTGQSNDT